MKKSRIIISHYGGPEELRFVEELCPEPKQGEVRVKVIAAGVSLPDVLMRQGIHPETPKLPFTPGWDLVGIAEKLGNAVTGIEKGQLVAALPISGAYTEYICLPENELINVPAGIDPAETVSLVLNYITAYQMMHRSAKVKAGQKVLIHGAAGGVGTALLQLGRLANLEMYGTCSVRNAETVREMGGIPIDYHEQDFVKEIRKLTRDGVNVAFDPIGGKHLWQSRKALCSGGKVIGYGLSTSLRGKGLTASRPGRRQRYRGTGLFGFYILSSWLLPGRKHIKPYSIQWLKRIKPSFFVQDMKELFDLLKQEKIKPIISHRFLFTQVKQAHELLEQGGVTGRIVLLMNENS